MSVQSKRALGRFVIFGLVGVLMEVFFTAAVGLWGGDWNMHGRSSPWMVPDYGLLGLLLMPIARPMLRRGIPLALRAGVYMIGIFIAEFVSGLVFTWCGLTIWDYSDLPWNLCGQITATYIPLWYGLGLIVERLYRGVDMVSLALVRGVTVEQIEAWGRGGAGGVDA